jgi:hypothetical protein
MEPEQISSSEPPPPPPSPWGPWATFGLLLAVVVVVVAAQAGVAVVAVVAQAVTDSHFDFEQLEKLATNGDVLACSALASALAALALVVILVRARPGFTLRSYLALEPVKLRVVLPWVAVTAVVLAAWDLMSAWIERPIVPDFMADAYASSGFLPLLWLAVIVAAPLWEELVFRGFAYPGLRRSSYGTAAAIGLPTLIWAGLHVQYDLYDWSFVVLLGILLGWAREKTGTVTVPLILHALVNLAATVEVALL